MNLSIQAPPQNPSQVPLSGAWPCTPQKNISSHDPPGSCPQSSSPHDWSACFHASLLAAQIVLSLDLR